MKKLLVAILLICLCIGFVSAEDTGMVKFLKSLIGENISLKIHAVNGVDNNYNFGLLKEVRDDCIILERISNQGTKNEFESIVCFQIKYITSVVKIIQKDNKKK